MACLPAVLGAHSLSYPLGSFLFPLSQGQGASLPQDIRSSRTLEYSWVWGKGTHPGYEVSSKQAQPARNNLLIWFIIQRIRREDTIDFWTHTHTHTGLHVSAIEGTGDALYTESFRTSFAHWTDTVLHCTSLSSACSDHTAQRALVCRIKHSPPVVYKWHLYE